MNKEIVEIPYELSVYLAKINYEYYTFLSIINLLTNSADISEEDLVYYINIFSKKNYELSTMKRMVAENYNPCPQFKNYNYKIDFDEDIIIYDYN